MITWLNVGGFKSLQKFRMRFSKGLNVLIGPNGAGKSNICQAFGLIASAAEGSISDYILSLGGVASVFTIDPTAPYNYGESRTMKLSCRGITKHVNSDEVTELKYRYTIELRFKHTLEITRENFVMLKNIPEEGFEVVLRASRYADKTTITIVRLKDIGPASLRIAQLTKKTPQLNVKLRPLNTCMDMLSTFFYYGHLVCQDMQLAKAWNIDPYVAKRSTDLLEPSTMLPDGRRLANAINAIFSTGEEDIHNMNYFLQEVIPRYHELKPETTSDKLTRSFSVVDTDGIVCPAHSLSDGTVKMIALLVGVRSQVDNTSIIEEPENYLHPWACQLLVDYFREFFSQGVCILTTHSETILNSIRPREIVVVENIDGFTKAIRLSSQRELERAIQDSGFGCGYHYLAGSLGGTP